MSNLYPSRLNGNNGDLLPEKHFIHPVLLVLLSAFAACLCYLVFYRGALDVSFIWADDMEWETSGLYSYLPKLQSEGRWLIFLWHRMIGIIPRQVSFYGILLLWCLVSAVISVMMVSNRRPLLAITGGVALAANPSVALLLMWPHTSFSVLVIYFLSIALLYLTRYRPTAFLIALVIGVVSTMLSYQLFSLLFVGCALFVLLMHAANDRHASFPGLLSRTVTTLIVSAAAIGAGIIIMYGFNYLYFGHFGLEDMEWRSRHVPVIESRIDLSLWNFRESLHSLLLITNYVLPVVGVVAASMLIFSTKNNLAGIYNGKAAIGLVLLVVAGVAAAPFLIPLVTGVTVPLDRGALTIWLAVVGLCLVTIYVIRSQLLQFAIVAGLSIITFMAFSSNGRNYAELNAQAKHNDKTIESILSDLRSVEIDNGLTGKTLVIAGNLDVLEGLAGIRSWYASVLFRRAIPETLEAIKVCPVLADCDLSQEMIAAAQAAPVYPLTGSIFTTGTNVIIKLGPLKSGADSKHNPHISQESTW